MQSPTSEGFLNDQGPLLGVKQRTICRQCKHEIDMRLKQSQPAYGRAEAAKFAACKACAGSRAIRSRSPKAQCDSSVESVGLRVFAYLALGADSSVEHLATAGEGLS